MIVKWLIFACINFGVFGNPFKKTDADANEYDRTPTPEIIKSFGYPVEVYHVTTEDGYILEIHRIPHGLENGSEKPKAVVYLQHPLFASSAEFVYLTPEKGLGFILADNGYDVWMPNTRGNFYSRNHTTLDPEKDSEFWNFTWHEMGVHDLPTSTDFILNKTGASDLLYIGHSQGTTMALVAGTRIPDLHKKIRSFHLLAPIAYTSCTTNLLIKFVATTDPLISAGTKVTGFQEFYPSDSFESYATQTFCTLVPAAGPEICSNFLFFAFGYDSEQFNRTLLPRILGHSPSGTSTGQIFHYVQLFNKPRFNEYHDGPDYDLGTIKVPTYLYTGANDDLADLKDVERLKKELGKALKEDYRVPWDKFNHGDFLFANDVKELLHVKLLQDMNRVVEEGRGNEGGNDAEQENVDGEGEEVKGTED